MWIFNSRVFKVMTCVIVLVLFCGIVNKENISTFVDLWSPGYFVVLYGGLHVGMMIWFYSMISPFDT